MGDVNWEITKSGLRARKAALVFYGLPVLTKQEVHLRCRGWHVIKSTTTWRLSVWGN